MTDPTHPLELLAGYVDGTLAQPERAVVDAHLSTCPVCREEVDLGREAVTALAALEDRPVPFGVTGPVLAEAGRRFERRRAVVWQRLQWSAGAVAAAALVLVVALNLSGDSGDRAQPAAAGAGGDAVTGATAEMSAPDAVPPRLEQQRAVTYDDSGVRSLAQEAVALGAAEAGEEDAADDALRVASRQQRDEALRCLRTSGAPLDEPRDTLVRLIEAQYQGTPAYFAVFHESPGAGQPPDSALVWVVATGDCRILTIASQSL